MCNYYLHIHSCAHEVYALGRLCASAALIQTPCKTVEIWTTVDIPEPCEECGGGVLAEATPRTPQLPEKPTARKEDRELKSKGGRRAGGFKGTRRS